jgi:hypothetical protein
MGSSAPAAISLGSLRHDLSAWKPSKRIRKDTLMHTVMVVGIGLVVLAVCLYLGYLLGAAPGLARAALVFLPLWLIGAGINMFIGVRSAGYAVTQEAPVLIVVFGIPAAVAIVAWCKLH